MTATLLHPQLKCPCHLSLPIGILYQAHCLMSSLFNERVAKRNGRQPGSMGSGTQGGETQGLTLLKTSAYRLAIGVSACNIPLSTCWQPQSFSLQDPGPGSQAE